MAGGGRVTIPKEFLDVAYNAAKFPVTDVSAGANCQAFAYAILRHFGRRISDFRSSELWEDVADTERVSELEPLDLLLFNATHDARGAHVGLYLGDGDVIHLSRRIARPAIWKLDAFVREPGYEVFIGAKRVRI
jgi:cell wall-associated NlpC family hydrolase